MPTAPALRLWLLLASVCIGLTVAAPIWAADALEITGPTTARGDGASPIRLTLHVTPPRAVQPGNLEVRTSAGKVSKLRAAGAGRFEFDFVPPRVVEETPVRVEAEQLRPHAAAPPLEITVSPSLGLVGQTATGGPLDLRVPKRLILGHHTEARVSLRSHDGVPIALAVSTGSITAPELGADGILRATYRPPEERFPQVAIVVAHSEDGRLLDWATIQLVGRPLVAAKSEPNTPVRVQVAGEEFGPVRTDARGKAELRVLVPPGVTKAQALARDRVGNVGAVPLKLGTPDIQHTFALCPPEAGGIWYFALDKRGLPRADLAVEATTSLGSVRTPEMVSPGAYHASVVFPDDARLGEAVRLSASIADEKESDAECTSRVPGEMPTALAVTLVKDAYVAGANRAVKIRVALTFPGKRQPRKVPLRASADFGQVDQLQPVTTTEYETSWAIPDDFEGRNSATVTVRSLSIPALSATKELRLLPGPVARLDATLDRARLPTDGRASAKLTVRAADKFGNRVSDATFSAAAAGSVGAFTRTEPGVFTARYTTPDQVLGADQIIVRDETSGATSRAVIQLTSPGSLLATAHLGYLTNFGKISSPIVRAGLWIRLPIFDDGFVAGVETAYYWSSFSESDTQSQERVGARLSAVPLLGVLTYELPWYPVTPHVGIGLGASLVGTRVSSESSGKIREAQTAFTISPMLGAFYPLGPGQIGGRLGYVKSEMDGSLRGNAGGVTLGVDYRLPL
jgi:hypothetical protein